MNVWRDKDGDHWVFSPTGEDAWVLDGDEWLLDGWERCKIEEAYAPLVAVDPPAGAPELPPGAAQ